MHFTDGQPERSTNHKVYIIPQYIDWTYYVFFCIQQNILARYTPAKIFQSA